METTLPVPRFANLSFITPRLAIGGDIAAEDALAAEQLAELGWLGITHVVDCRVEWSDEQLFAEHLPHIAYLRHGMDDAGQRVPAAWFDQALDWIDAAGPDAVVLTHCHMGINRGPSLGFAVLLHQGWDPIAAISLIRAARPIANVWYADDALKWHHGRRQTGPRANLGRLALWREANPLDVVRIIRQQRGLDVDPREQGPQMNEPSSPAPQGVGAPEVPAGMDAAEAGFPPHPDDLTDETPSPDVLRALDDDDDPREDIVRTLAGYFWASTGAGAGWSGSGVLGTTHEGQTFSVIREDWNSETAEVQLPEESTLLGQQVAAWVREHDSVASAALALEPLDPNSTLTDAERASWVALLSKLELFFRTDLQGPELLALRRALAGRAEPYRMIRQALAEPSSRHGQSLRTTLENAWADGSTGGLESGNWDEAE